MEFRKSVKADINDIMNIIKQAQDYFKQNGIDQWQDNYPNVDIINDDICNDNSYVLLKDNVIVATFAVSFNREKTYDFIYDGEWISNGKYAVVHRVAVHNNFKGMGLAYKIIKNVQKFCLSKGIYSIKMDTQKHNIPMKNVFLKSGFKYCGVIYLEDKSERIAFEKILE